MQRSRLIAILLVLALQSQAQTWQSVSFESNMVWQAAELNGKLYIADGGSGLYEFNGTSWNHLNDFNNSSNTPHRSKSSVVNIDGLLYAGARDFNTSGQGIIHTFNGSAFSLFQNTNFSYNGSHKVFDFAKYNGTIYAGGQFIAPNNGSANITRWNGSDWEGCGTNSFNYLGNQNNVVSRLTTFSNKLYVMASGKVLFYNGSAWDSLSTMYSAFEDMTVYNSELVTCGMIVIAENQTPIASGTIVRWNGSELSVLNNPYYAVHRLYSEGNSLYAIVQMDFQGDVYLAKYNGSSWSLESLLQVGSGGVVPGYPLSDYNRIFRFNGDLYIGGRFTQIGNNSIQSLARFISGPSVPAAPSDLTATPVNSIALAWQDNSDNEDGFLLEYTLDFPGGPWLEVATVSANETSYIHTGLTEGLTYHYRVRAFNAQGSSGWSNVASATDGEVSIGKLASGSLISIYPNPAADQLTISGIGRDSQLIITDMHGRQVLRAALRDKLNTVDVSELVSGIYLIHVLYDGQRKVEKVIVRR